jgi:hypothetical protein
LEADEVGTEHAVEDFFAACIFCFCVQRKLELAYMR